MSRPTNKEDQLRRIILLNSFRDSSGYKYVSQTGVVSNKSEKEFKTLMNKLLPDTSLRTMTPEFRGILTGLGVNANDSGFVLADVPRDDFLKEFINAHKDFSFSTNGYESLESYASTVIQNMSSSTVFTEPKKEAGVDTSAARVINPDLTLAENVELEEVLQESVVQNLVQQRAELTQAKSDMKQGIPIKDSALNPEAIETPVVGNAPTEQLSVQDISAQAGSVAGHLNASSMTTIQVNEINSVPSAITEVSNPNSSIPTIPDSVAPIGTSVVSDASSIPSPAETSDSDPTKPTEQAAQIVEPYTNDFHKSSVLLFLGNPPVFDPEINNTVDSLKLSTSEANEMMDHIIKANGDKILVSKRQSNGNKEELKVLLQLHFCLERNLARGQRQKMALVPLSSLIDLRNTAAQTVQDPFVEAANMPTEGGITQDTPLPSTDPVMQSAAVQKSLERKVQIDDVVEAYRKRDYTKTGKAMLKTRYGQLTKESIQNQNQLDLIGSSSSNDPLGERHLTAVNKIRPSGIRYRNIE